VAGAGIDGGAYGSAVLSGGDALFSARVGLCWTGICFDDWVRANRLLCGAISSCFVRRRFRKAIEDLMAEFCRCGAADGGTIRCCAAWGPA